eukprot:PhM_4_TR13951/c5_g2_i2/m.32168
MSQKKPVQESVVDSEAVVALQALRGVDVSDVAVLMSPCDICGTKRSFDCLLDAIKHFESERHRSKMPTREPASAENSSTSPTLPLKALVPHTSAEEQAEYDKILGLFEGVKLVSHGGQGFARNLIFTGQGQIRMFLSECGSVAPLCQSRGLPPNFDTKFAFEMDFFARVCYDDTSAAEDEVLRVFNIGLSLGENLRNLPVVLFELTMDRNEIEMVYKLIQLEVRIIAYKVHRLFKRSEEPTFHAVGVVVPDTAFVRRIFSGVADSLVHLQALDNDGKFHILEANEPFENRFLDSIDKQTKAIINHCKDETQQILARMGEMDKQTQNILKQMGEQNQKILKKMSEQNQKTKSRRKRFSIR